MVSDRMKPYLSTTLNAEKEAGMTVEEMSKKHGLKTTTIEELLEWTEETTEEGGEDDA